jgi:integrase
MEVHRAWRRILLTAKVRYRPPEQLRHTFASTLLSRNAPLLYVQQQGGWRSASVLLRVYARWMPQAVAAVAPSGTLLSPASDGGAAAMPQNPA